MREMEYNEPLTVGKLKDALKDVRDDVNINVLNQAGKSTVTIFAWREDLPTRH